MRGAPPPGEKALVARQRLAALAPGLIQPGRIGAAETGGIGALVRPFQPGQLLGGEQRLEADGVEALGDALQTGIAAEPVEAVKAARRGGARLWMKALRVWSIGDSNRRNRLSWRGAGRASH